MGALELLKCEAGAQPDPEIVVALRVHCLGPRGVLTTYQWLWRDRIAGFIH